MTGWGEWENKNLQQFFLLVKIFKSTEKRKVVPKLSIISFLKNGFLALHHIKWPFNLNLPPSPPPPPPPIYCQFVDPVQPADKAICKFYANGKCKFNTECRFSHPKICQKLCQHGDSKLDSKGCDGKCDEFHPNVYLMCLSWHSFWLSLVHWSYKSIHCHIWWLKLFSFIKVDSLRE